MHINSSTLHLNAALQALVQRKRHWRMPPEHLQHTALISTHRGPRPLDSTLSPAKERAVVSQQVERHAFETIGRIHCLAYLRTINN